MTARDDHAQGRRLAEAQISRHHMGTCCRESPASLSAECNCGHELIAPVLARLERLERAAKDVVDSRDNDAIGSISYTTLPKIEALRAALADEGADG